MNNSREIITMHISIVVEFFLPLKAQNGAKIKWKIMSFSLQGEEWFMNE